MVAIKVVKVAPGEHVPADSGQDNSIQTKSIIAELPTGLTLLEKAEQLRGMLHKNISKAQLYEIEEFLLRHDKEVKAEVRWLEFGLPRQVQLSAPDCIQALMQSRVAHHILMYATSTKCGALTHGVRLDTDQHPLLLMNAKWTRWEQISREIVYDDTKECFVSRDSSAVLWNYISPQGFIAKDPNAQKLYPIDLLDAKEYSALTEHAATFWNSYPEVDVGSKKPCVLQFFTSQTDQVTRNWLTEGILDCAAKHVGMRLVDSDGRLYSFGVEVTQEFREFLKASSCPDTATGYSKIVIPDYTEHQHFDRRFVTSIPLTTDRLEKIVSYIESINHGIGTPFCILRPNCMSFALKVLELGGVTMGGSMTVVEVVQIALPRFEKVTASMSICKKIWGAVSAIFTAVCPPIIFVARSISFIASKTTNLVVNLALMYFSVTNRMGTGGPFPKRSFRDLFADVIIDHSVQLVRWQRALNHGTKCYFYKGKPSMCNVYNELL